MLRIRTYQTNDEQAILDLDRKVMPSDWNPRTLDNWQWKFSGENPSGHAFIWLAEREEEIIAHFAAVPMPLNVFGDVVRGSHTIGALVDERYQNRGLLKLVADRLWEDLSGHDVPLTWGFPNSRAYALHKLFLGYKDLIHFDTWKLTNPAAKGERLTPFFRPVKEFDDNFDHLWRDCLKDYGILVVRDKKHLNWRYARRPDWTYYPFGYYQDDTLKGYVVLKLYREGHILKGHIIDIFAAAEDEHTFVRLIEGSLIFFARNEVDHVTLWIWGSAMMEGLLSENGFLKTDEKRPLVLRFNSELKNQDRILDSSHWYFTMGDSTEIF